MTTAENMRHERGEKRSHTQRAKTFGYTRAGLLKFVYYRRHEVRLSIEAGREESRKSYFYEYAPRAHTLLRLEHCRFSVRCSVYIRSYDEQPDLLFGDVQHYLRILIMRKSCSWI